MLIEYVFQLQLGLKISVVIVKGKFAGYHVGKLFLWFRGVLITLPEVELPKQPNFKPT